MKQIGGRILILCKSTVVHMTKGINWLVLLKNVISSKKSFCLMFLQQITRQILQSTTCKWLIQKIHTMKSMGVQRVYVFSGEVEDSFILVRIVQYCSYLIEKLISKKSWSYWTIHWLTENDSQEMCMPHKKTSLHRIVGAN